MLCDICSNIDPDQLAVETKSGEGIPRSIRSHSEYGYRYHENVDDLFRGADSGCGFCRVVRDHVLSRSGGPPEGALWLGIARGRRGWAPDGPTSELMVYEFPWGHLSFLQIARLGTYVQTGSFSHTASFTSQILPSLGSSTSRHDEYCTSGRSLSADPASEECVALAKEWIQDCLQHHSFCNALGSQSGCDLKSEEQASVKNTDSIFVPTRTIDVGPSDGSQEPKICLHGQSYSDHPIKWVALSHRWGGSSSHMTTTANLQASKKEMSIRDMPKTFQDAVFITRKLGLRYLWIDCLCIIQDSPEDWASEAARMGGVYKYSYVTIAANSAQNCDDGFLKLRTIEQPLAQLEICNTKTDKVETIYIRKPLKHWETNIESSTLHTRAWALQEYLLSPRTLHYSDEQLLWECRVTRSSEGDINLLGPVLAEGLNRYESNLTKWSINAILGEDSSISLLTHPSFYNPLYVQWYLIVVEYSARSMTVSADKLPAIAGLAAEFSKRLGDTYYAGLLGKDLYRGLLWQVHDGESAKRPSTYRAPSWSWASLDAGVEYDGLIFKEPQDRYVYQGEVLDISVQPSGIDVFGHISAGSITIRGRWRYLSLYGISDWRPSYSDVKTNRANFRDEGKGLQPVLCFFDTAKDLTEAKRHYTNPEDDREGRVGILMLIGWARGWGDRVSNFMDGIIIRANRSQDESERQQYTRIGWATLSDHVFDDPGFSGWTPWEMKTVTII